MAAVSGEGSVAVAEVGVAVAVVGAVVVDYRVVAERQEAGNTMQARS